MENQEENTVNPRAIHLRAASLSEMIDGVENKRTKNYIQNRIIPQMAWYSNKSAVYKKQYLRWNTVSILTGAMIPVFSVFSNADLFIKVLIAALGVTTVAVNAYLALYNSKQLWFTYRNIRETLLKLLYTYFNDAGAFAQDSTQAEKDIRLINLCESEISGENSQWMSSSDE